MVATLLSLLFIVIIAVLVFYVLRMLQLPAPWGVIVQVLAILIFIIVLLEMFLGSGSLNLHFRS